jgi:hypothetical protein
MTLFKRLTSALALISLLTFAACGGGSGGSGSPPFGGPGSGGTGSGGTGSGGTGSGGTGNTGTAALVVSLSNSTVSSAAPVTVTAKATTATGAAAANVVLTFSTSNGLGSFSATTALTNSSGVATVTLSPTVSSSSGADTVVATGTVNGAAVNGTVGFSLVATTASITSFTSIGGATAASPLSAYGQSVLTVGLSGASSATPVTLSLTSACVSAGKAKISPATTTATSSTVSFTYQDTGGCGSTLTSDTLTASISGSSTSQALQIYLSSPAANNIVFVQATPPTIYLQGTGLTTSSQVIFQVNDRANNPLPGQVVSLGLSTYIGGLTINGMGATNGVPPTIPTQTTDSNGQITVLVNSGTVPTPVRVSATLAASGITTVSSNLSVAVGLPSELNFSLAQTTANIEGYNRDGTANAYSIRASDRLGNPVPDGTAINFVSEGGQVQAAAFTATIADATKPCPVATPASSSSGGALSCAVAQFQTSEPRPLDGRVTVMAYALGEKSFVDENGDNVFTSADTHQWFQDLGNPYLDTLFNGQFGSSANNQFFAQTPAGSSACNSTLPSSLPTRLQLDVSIPSEPNTCTGSWGKAYVRRAVETIFSTSAANPMWGTSSPSNAYGPLVNGVAQCGPTTLIVPNTGSSTAYDANGVPTKAVYYQVGVASLYNSPGGVVTFLASDANPYAFNPVAAGSTITATPTDGMTATVVGGSPVPSSGTPPPVSIAYAFPTATSGTITIAITSPSGLTTTLGLFISSVAPADLTTVGLCP